MTEQDYDKEQLRIMRNAFKAFDHDEKGTIDYSDVQTILEILGQKLDEKAIAALLKEVDKGKSGKLDFNQFCRLASRFVEVEEDANALASELKEAFRVYDKEGKGYLTVQVLRDILHELDDKISNTDLDSIIEEIDADGSGTVDFDEFMQVMTGNGVCDFSLNRRFVFEPLASLPSPLLHSSHPSHCYYPPTRRLRLHRRIELHLQRFMQQMVEPFVFPSVRQRARIFSSPTAAALSPTPATATATATSTASPALPATSSSTSSSTSAPTPSTSNIANKPSSTNIAKASPIPQTIAKFSASHGQVFSASSTTTCCYRPTYRPRFPRWVPILTLYREIVQHPFRRSRARYMIKHDQL